MNDEERQAYRTMLVRLQQTFQRYATNHRAKTGLTDAEQFSTDAKAQANEALVGEIGGLLVRFS